jgi:hypothetical protein
MAEDHDGRLLKSTATFLARWNGEQVWVRDLTYGHRTLSVVVFRDYSTLASENLVFGAEPLWMRGPFEWAPAALEMDVVAAAETPAGPFTNADRLFRLRDPVGFELLTSAFAVRENVGLRGAR